MENIEETESYCVCELLEDELIPLIEGQSKEAAIKFLEGLGEVKTRSLIVRERGQND